MSLNKITKWKKTKCDKCKKYKWYVAVFFSDIRLCKHCCFKFAGYCPDRINGEWMKRMLKLYSRY